MTIEALEERLTAEQSQVFNTLNSPAEVQAFLDSIPYSPEHANRSPASVLRDRQAHCLDGALFAAAALRRLGESPLVVDLLPDPGMDDDHVLAIYTRNGHFGAIAKSNYAGLRYREPIHRNLRELVLTYFEPFYSVKGIKTLRTYTRPVNLTAFDHMGWMWDDTAVEDIEKYLQQRARRVSVITPEMAARLSPVDQRSYDAGLLGADPAGLYQPKT